MQYTRDQVLQLAPDDASAKAGQQLANHAKWVTKSMHSKALWGDCQGSGKTPYITIIDLQNIAFKCSCPSRKFPCKHGLGLLLLYSQQSDVFTKSEELPQHVSEWLNKREGKEAAKELKETGPPDEAAQAKRIAAREKKVDAGIEELRLWIKDAVRTGIMNVPQNSYRFSQNITARMVDAQAGGLANQLRQIHNIHFYEEGWHRALIKRLSGIYLITEAFRHIDMLPQEMAKEIQTLIGWITTKEEVLQGTPVRDTWVVLSVSVTEDQNLSTEKIWLYSLTEKRFALLLHFYAASQIPQHFLFPGLHIEADVVFFPGLTPLRALIKEQRTVPATGIQIEADHSVQSVYHKITAQLAQNPFAEQIPFLLNNVQVTFRDKTWLLYDHDKQGFAIANPEEACWRILAFTRGKAFSCFGIYENEQFSIHTLWSPDKTYFIK
ncbi:SWIM zinc finger family protein [Dyadobacter sediminis]|uniref:SWIM zinc finger family protein n=1 Tax=Dyadobacter sediminis TaxID=1493691 RepID=A0A5R9KAY6_9BACT|nr:SWIM zinc finger family protein [Dyadobacter sediminis]TLU91934.1 SWIM zinc finger family protein [Dyadobacter sediminis]GGB98994.1 hypothetical protein GCM10011325_27760 [Dyadobacter sediminis]